MSSETVSRLPVKAGWLVIKPWDMVVGCSPKCGSGSIRAAVEAEGHDWWKRADPYAHKNRVFIVRHPLDRFESLWRNKARDGGRLSRGGGRGMHDVLGMTPRELFEYSKLNPNHHWTPQSVLRADVPCLVVRLEEVGMWWDGLAQTTKPYPKVNPTQGKVPIDEKLRKEILTYYDADVQLWGSSCEYN